MFARKTPWLAAVLIACVACEPIPRTPVPRGPVLPQPSSLKLLPTCLLVRHEDWPITTAKRIMFLNDLGYTLQPGYKIVVTLKKADRTNASNPPGVIIDLQTWVPPNTRYYSQDYVSVLGDARGCEAQVVIFKEGQSVPDWRVIH